MKEFSVPLDVFKMGLRKSDVRQTNLPGLVECLGFRLGEDGLEASIGITNPIVDSNGAYDWPFPQLAATSIGIYLLTETAIYSVNVDWSITQEIADLDPGGVWEILDFGALVIFNNGVCVVVNDTETGLFSVADAATVPVCTTMCNFRGQVIIGNTVKGENWVEWSDIGSLTFTYERGNEAGGRHMPWNGAVLRVAALGNMVAVYGESGIGLLTPEAKPIVAFGYKPISELGVLARNAVGIGEKRHVFIGQDKQLYSMSDGGVELLGYKEFFENMTPSSIGIVYNPIEEDFYISDGMDSYVLTDQGLTELTEAIAGGIALDGSFVGVSSAVETEYRRLVTNALDLNYRAQKTTQMVLLGSTEQDTLEVGFDWRMGTRNAFVRSRFFPVNLEGISHAVVSGVEHRLVLQWPIAESPDLPGDITIAYKVTDKRGIRGTNVPDKSNA